MSTVEEGDFFAVWTTSATHRCLFSALIKARCSSVSLLKLITLIEERHQKNSGPSVFSRFQHNPAHEGSGTDAAAAMAHQDVAVLFRNAESASDRSAVVVHGLRAKLADALGIPTRGEGGFCLGAATKSIESQHNVNI